MTVSVEEITARYRLKKIYKIFAMLSLVYVLTIIFLVWLNMEQRRFNRELIKVRGLLGLVVGECLEVSQAMQDMMTDRYGVLVDSEEEYTKQLIEEEEEKEDAKRPSPK